MTSSGWDEYVADGDLDVPAGESDVDYAGFDAAAASAVSTDLVDGVVADESADTPADGATVLPETVVETVLEAVDNAAFTQHWADWNAAPATEWASSADSYAETAAAEGYTDLAAEHHDMAVADLHAAEQELGWYDPSGDDAS